MRELVGEAKFGAVLQFPAMRLPARRLAALAPGAVLRLPMAKHADSELRVAGLRFGRAHPVSTGEHRGAQLETGCDSDETSSAVENQSLAATTSVN